VLCPSAISDFHIRIHHWWVFDDPYTTLICDLLCIPSVSPEIWIKHSALLNRVLWWSLGFVTWNCVWQNPNSDKTTQSHRIFKTASSESWHFSHMELFSSPSLNAWYCAIDASVNSTSYLAIIVAEFFGWRFSRGVVYNFLSSCGLPVFLMTSFQPVLESTFSNSFLGGTGQLRFYKSNLYQVIGHLFPFNFTMPWHQYNLYLDTFTQFYQGLMAIPD
jgi:hypothetical protein